VVAHEVAERGAAGVGDRLGADLAGGAVLDADDRGLLGDAAARADAIAVGCVLVGLEPAEVALVTSTGPASGSSPSTAHV